MATKSARKRKHRTLNVINGQAIILNIKMVEKSHYDPSIGRLRALAEWRKSR